MKNRSFEVLFHKQIRNARSKRCPDRASGQDVGETWFVAGCPNDVGRLSHIKLIIRTAHPDRICYRPGMMFTSAVCFNLRESGQGSALRVLLRNPDGVDPDSLAHSMSSGRGALHLAHADGPPCATQLSPPREEFRPPTFHIRNSVRRHFTSGYLTAGWERKTFQLLWSDISGSSYSTYPESFLSVYSATVFS